MDSWNGMAYEGKETILRVVSQEADQFFDLVDRADAWEAPTGAGGWEVRDVVGHLVDTTEAYFVGFDAARAGTKVGEMYGLPAMHERVNEQATGLSRTVPREELVDRARADFTRMMQILDGLGPDDWGGLTVEHVYMGPLPAFFYPAFQLMDYGVHSWDVRQGTGRAHGLSGEAADLLVPFMFVLWSATVSAGDVQPYDIGVRITSGPNAGDTLVHVGEDGMTYEAGGSPGVDPVLEFDPGSFVLTAFGRSNSGTIRGDRATADRYLNLFFRI